MTGAEPIAAMLETDLAREHALMVEKLVADHHLTGAIRFDSYIISDGAVAARSTIEFGKD